MQDQTFSRFPPERLFSCGNGGRAYRRTGAGGGEAAPRVPPSSRKGGFLMPKDKPFVPDRNV